MSLPRRVLYCLASCRRRHTRPLSFVAVLACIALIYIYSSISLQLHVIKHSRRGDQNNIAEVLSLIHNSNIRVIGGAAKDKDPRVSIYVQTSGPNPELFHALNAPHCAKYPSAGLAGTIRQVRPSTACSLSTVPWPRSSADEGPWFSLVQGGGNCTIKEKLKNVQKAGASGAIIVTYRATPGNSLSRGKVSVFGEDNDFAWSAEKLTGRREQGSSVLAMLSTKKNTETRLRVGEDSKRDIPAATIDTTQGQMIKELIERDPVKAPNVIIVPTSSILLSLMLWLSVLVVSLGMCSVVITCSYCYFRQQGDTVSRTVNRWTGRTLTLSQLSRLRDVAYVPQELQIEEQADQDQSYRSTHADMCSICLEDFVRGIRMRILPCQHGRVSLKRELGRNGHRDLSDRSEQSPRQRQNADSISSPSLSAVSAFHAMCVDRWLTERRGTCPICKIPVMELLDRSSDNAASQEGPHSGRNWCRRQCHRLRILVTQVLSLGRRPVSREDLHIDGTESNIIDEEDTSRVPLIIPPTHVVGRR